MGISVRKYHLKEREKEMGMQRKYNLGCVIAEVKLIACNILVSYPQNYLHIRKSITDNR